MGETCFHICIECSHEWKDYKLYSHCPQCDFRNKGSCARKQPAPTVEMKEHMKKYASSIGGLLLTDNAIRNIVDKLPREYKLMRVVAVALDELQDGLGDHDHEQRVVDKYGTELLELLNSFDNEGEG